MCPMNTWATVMELCQEKRGTFQNNLHYLAANRVMVHL